MQQVLLSNNLVRLSREESAAMQDRTKIQLVERYDTSVNDVLVYEARKKSRFRSAMIILEIKKIAFSAGNATKDNRFRFVPIFLRIVEHF